MIWGHSNLKGWDEAKKKGERTWVRTEKRRDDVTVSENDPLLYFTTACL